MVPHRPARATHAARRLRYVEKRKPQIGINLEMKV